MRQLFTSSASCSSAICKSATYDASAGDAAADDSLPRDGSWLHAMGPAPVSASWIPRRLLCSTSLSAALSAACARLWPADADTRCAPRSEPRFALVGLDGRTEVVVQLAVSRALLPDKGRPRVAILLSGIANCATGRHVERSLRILYNS